MKFYLYDFYFEKRVEELLTIINVFAILLLGKWCAFIRKISIRYRSSIEVFYW